MYHKFDACELSDLIEATYGLEFNVAYHWLQDQRKVEVVGISKNPAESDKWCRQKLQSELNGEDWDLSLPPLMHYIMCDLCAKDKLEEGDYFVCFDD